MAINFSTDPYYDDYNETKGFQRILFKPGVAVQARELNQLQTTIQKQIERFGKNVFKEGSIVIPGEQVLDARYNFIKLTSTFNTFTTDDILEDLQDQIVVGATTGVRALVVNTTVSTDTDSPTIYVKYLNSGANGETSVFNNSEVISTEDTTLSVQAISSAATGTGTAFSIGSGAMFVKGIFAYFNEQTKIVSKYSQITDLIIGFDVTESIVDSDADSSLLDPAAGTFNYFAPGADRYKISLDLNTRAFTPTEVDDPNFVELVRIQDGLVIRQITDSNYNLLNDTLARRTFDESGDYVVRPYKIELAEHLRTSNASIATTVRDGVYPAPNGDDNKFVGVITAGKAYVKGYEIDSIRNKYANIDKSRDYASVTNGTIATTFGNFVYVTNINGIPDITDLPLVSIYNQFNLTPATPNGTLIGTARIRAIDYHSGTPGTSTAVYKVFLFDVNITTGFSFARNAKQFYFNNPSREDFTADIQPEQAQLTGTVTVTTTGNTITGSGTRFTTDLVVGDFVRINTETLRVVDVASNFSANVLTTPSANASGISINVLTATINDPSFNTYVFPLPYNTIKEVDSTGVATTYTTRRSYARTLTGGNVSITAGVDEVFTGYSADNYQVVLASGANDGDWIDLTGKVTRSGVPTGKTVTFTLGGGLTTEDVIITTTVQKSLSAADRKTKTLVTGAFVDFTTEAAATAAVLKLNKADVYRLSNVSMSANAFGTAFNTLNSATVTENYSLDNGQRTTFYDVGSVRLLSNAAKPTGPIRVYFDYFTHGTGDYFSVESYGDINYKDIPSFTTGGITYSLRDSLDFRPRINDAGTGFTGTGASTTEFLDFTNDLITDYAYYLPRIDKLVLDRTGRVRVVKGISSLLPKEPTAPDDSMALYVLKQNPYVFDLSKDVEVISVDNRRYTMRDIGRIENRVKNLEYYTSLSLAEQDARIFQIKDALGFDRFKNGFVVDSFKGHGIGDAFNPDYAIAIDYNKKEARPLCETKFVKLDEVATDTVTRAASNYVLNGDIATISYTEELLISNNKASKSVNLNPFNIVNFSGKITLDPPSDIWFDDTRVPDIYRNVEGNYDTLLAEARAKGTYGTVWGNWRDMYYGNSGTELVQQRTGIDYSVSETIETTVNNDVVLTRSIIPKMRDAVINFTAEGMKPNTRLYAYFNDVNVTPYVLGKLAPAANATVAFALTGDTTQPIKTDAAGNAAGKFSYTASMFNFNTGTFTFKLSDSIGNLTGDEETYAQTLFTSSGELRNIANEIISTRNAVLTTKEVTDTNTVYVGGYSYDDVDYPPSVPPADRNNGYIGMVYNYAFGRDLDPAGLEYWTSRFEAQGVTAATIQSMQVSGEYIGPGVNGGILASNDGVTANIPNTYNAAAERVYNATLELIGSDRPNGKPSDSMVAVHKANGASTENAEVFSALQIVTAVANPVLVNFLLPGVANDVNSARTKL